MRPAALRMRSGNGPFWQVGALFAVIISRSLRPLFFLHPPFRALGYALPLSSCPPGFRRATLPAPPASTRSPPTSTHSPLASTRSPPASTRSPPATARLRAPSVHGICAAAYPHLDPLAHVPLHTLPSPHVPASSRHPLPGPTCLTPWIGLGVCRPASPRPSPRHTRLTPPPSATRSLEC
ncbi:hypothetical protein B0H13DRAFT_2663677 [Mycena leptocephala]|nr:hypothetical protein B0H13DRAFT_2663677 [Mycena leptocephala]